MITAIALIALGLAALTAGGEALVRGASRLAGLLGVSPLVIGLTVVAFGTSAPELAVSLNASRGGGTDIAVGNVVGSNIFNVLFILGVSALISPLVVSSRLIRLDVPLMIAASVTTLLLGLDGAIARWEGAGMFAAVLLYVGWTVRDSRREVAAVRREFEQAFEKKPRRTRADTLWQIALIAVGLALLTLGAKWLVDGAAGLARLAGMSELLIGLTIVAAGTSLPEVAASVLASLRGERDIAVGNVVGSNLFNLLCVLGLTAAATPGGVPVSPQAVSLDIPIMIAVAVACLPIFFTGHEIARWEGGLFLAYYAAYMAHLILTAIDPTAGRTFGFVMFAFVAPLTAVTLTVSVTRRVRRGRRSRGG